MSISKLTEWSGDTSTSASLTSSSVTIPSNCQLFCLVTMDESSGATNAPVFTNSSGQTWTEIGRQDGANTTGGSASVWTTAITTGGSGTVTFRGSTSTANKAHATLLCLDNPAGTAYNSTVVKGHSTTGNLTASFGNSTAANSLVIGCAVDWSASGSPTSTEAGSAPYHSAGFISSQTAWKTATVASGVSESINYHNTASPARDWNYIVVEIFAAASFGGSGISGNLSQTIANFTSTATGQVKVQGSLNQTISNFTSSATGTVLMTGFANITLDNFIVSGTGTVKMSGSLNQTIDNFTVAGTGIVGGGGPVSGSLSKTIDAFTIAAQGGVQVSGVLAKTIDNFTVNATGVLGGGPVTGNLSASIGNFVSENSFRVLEWQGSDDPHAGYFVYWGLVAPSGANVPAPDNYTNVAYIPSTTDNSGTTLSYLIPALIPGRMYYADITSTKTGNHDALESLLGTAMTFTADTAGPLGELNQSIGNFTLAASGAVKKTGSLNATIDPFTLSGTGKVDIKGSLDASLGEFTSTATGQVLVRGSLNTQIGDFTLQGGGTTVGGRVGVLDSQIAPFTLNATGVVPITGNGGGYIGNFTLSATGSSGAAPGVRQTYRDGALVAQATAASNRITFQYRDNVNLGWFRFAPVYSNAEVGEIIILPGYITDSDLQTITDNQKTYWNTYAPPPVVEAGPGPKLQYVGVNISGYESGFGTLGPTNASIDYWVNRNANIFRLPFDWKRLQPTLFGPLDPTNLALIKAKVDYLTTKGVVVILDVHSYGKYEVVSGDGGLNGTPENMADLWTKIATEFISYDNVWFGLMNEPVQGPGSAWLPFVNAMISAIRGIGATQKILVAPCSGGSAGHYFEQSGTSFASGVVDPLNNWILEVHQYFDAGSSGESGTVLSEGYGVQLLHMITQWARQEGHQLFLGEFGTGENASATTCLKYVMYLLQKYADVWIGATLWGAGGRWSTTYPLRAEGLNFTDLEHSMMVMSFAPGGSRRGYTSPTPINGVPLTMTTPTYVASNNGQALTVGYGTSPFKFYLCDVSLCIDLYIKATNLPAVPEGLFGQKGFIDVQLNTSGRLYIYYGGGTTAIQLTGTTNLVTSTWRHIRLNFDKNSGFKCFIDGVLEMQNVKTLNQAGITRGGPNLAVGYSIKTGRPAFSGQTDWCAFYYKSLSQSSFTPPTTPPALDSDALYANWSFDGNGNGEFF